jgi:hypothetical protein
MIMSSHLPTYEGFVALLINNIVSEPGLKNGTDIFTTVVFSPYFIILRNVL